MPILNLRLPWELKSALASLPGTIAANAREALEAHTRVSFLSSRLGWPRGLCALVLGVCDQMAQSNDLDAKCVALTYDCQLSLALDSARAGVESSIPLLPPKEILNRAAAIASALVKDETNEP